MESALAWIGDIASWFGKWIPRWEIIDTTHGWVKFVKGSTIKSGGAGLEWYWPATTIFYTHPTARQTSNLKTQTITTADDRTIAVGGMLVFEISDIEKIVAHTFDPDETVRDITMGSIHDVLSLLTWDEIKAQQRDGILDRKLKAEAKKDLDRYGVRVLRMTLTELAPCRVFKLVQSTSQD